MNDNRLVICIDGLHASTLCKEFADKYGGKHFKYKSTVEVNDISYHFVSVLQLRNGRTDGERFSEVKVSEGVYMRDDRDIQMLEQLKAQTKIWKSYLINNKQDA